MTVLNGAGYTITVRSDEPNSATTILDAAIQEFDDLGFLEGSISHIAQRAGVSKALVVYHFPTKAALASTIVNMAYPSGVFMGAAREDEDPLEAIVTAVDHVAYSITHHQLPRVAIKLHHRRELRGDGSPAKYSGWLARITDHLEEARRLEVIAENVDAGIQARLLVASISGLIGMATGASDYLTLVEDAHTIVTERVALITDRCHLATLHATP